MSTPPSCWKDQADENGPRHDQEDRSSSQEDGSHKYHDGNPIPWFWGSNDGWLRLHNFIDQDQRKARVSKPWCSCSMAGCGRLNAMQIWREGTFLFHKKLTVAASLFWCLKSFHHPIIFRFGAWKDRDRCTVPPTPASRTARSWSKITTLHSRWRPRTSSRTRWWLSTEASIS